MNHVSLCQCDIATPTTGDGVDFSILFNLGWSCDLLQRRDSGELDIVLVLEPGSEEAFLFPSSLSLSRNS